MKLVIDLQGAQTESRLRGIGRQARQHALAMIEHATEHDVYILLNAGLREGLDSLREEFGRLLGPDHVKLFNIPGHVRELEIGNMWRMRAAELVREAYLADLKADIVYITSLYEGVSDDAVTSIGLMQAPHATAATLHDLIPLSDPDAYLGAGFMQQFYYRRSQSLKRADKLIAVSQSARREGIDLLNIPPERIDVALLAAEATFRHVGLSGGKAEALRARYKLPESFILYVGAIEPRKNIPLIIEAFGQLPAAIRAQNTLVFGGKLHEQERLQLRTAAARFGVDADRILFPGFIAEADLPSLYELCSLFVFPSMQEGFGLPPLEAMACGAPVLAARNSSLPEVIGRDDLMFGTFDAEDLAAKMTRVLTDRAYADSLRAWSLDRASQFSWKRTAAETMASLETLHDQRRLSRTHATFRRRPRLAFVSPLPGDRSGVATYGAELLRELGCHYDVECVIYGTEVSDPWIFANFTIRNVEYFREFGGSYDRVVYQIGNSEFHSHMFELLEEIPGVVILHDFFLSGVLDWLGNTGRRPPEDFLRELYLTHGLPALDYVRRHDRHAAAAVYPANRVIFENALGVIVHSQWAIARAEELYGSEVRDLMVKLPHMRAVRARADRAAARKRLGIDDETFLVCSFGMVADTKLSDRLVVAWTRSQIGQQAVSQLVLVGELAGGPWGAEMAAAVDGAVDEARISITGYVDAKTYGDYLAAADLAVQLRTRSRGETSGAIIDCMAAGLPTIANAHGTAGEHGGGVLHLLPDIFTEHDLADAIDALWADPGERLSLGQRAVDEIRTIHHPDTVALGFRDAIDRFHEDSANGRQRRVSERLRELHAPTYPTEHDFGLLAEALTRNGRRVGPRRIFFDITLLAQSDAHTGIERVVRAVFSELVAKTPEGYRLEPVRIEDGRLRYARAFTAHALGIAADVLPDGPVDYASGDIYLMLEWAADLLPGIADWLQDFRRHGGRVVIQIHDLLPLQMPHRFPPHIEGVCQRWFETVLRVADQLVCGSRVVAGDVVRFGNGLIESRTTPIAVDLFGLASDLGGSIPTRGLPDDAAEMLAAMAERPTFVMVGTVEPRKGHIQTIEAFEQLWARGVDVALVIVGRRGWMIETVERLIARSRERNRRLFWLQGVSDEYLGLIYAGAKALIGASEGEGFGLPLIEAAAHAVPLIVRDIPIFREVTGGHAFYFSSITPEGMADEIETWLWQAQSGEIPGSIAIPALRWSESVEQLLGAIFADSHYAMLGKGADSTAS